LTGSSRLEPGDEFGKAVVRTNTPAKAFVETEAGVLEASLIDDRAVHKFRVEFDQFLHGGVGDIWPGSTGPAAILRTRW